MPKPISLSLLVLLCTLPAAAQRDSSSRKTTKKPAIRPVRQTVVVVGSPEPVTLGESQRSVYVINTKQQPQTFQTAESYLRNDPSVFVEQRGAGGAQADISILGSSFEQTLVLVNGLRMNDSQTAHHDMDLPVPMAAMRSVEVLHGAGSTLYGSDAIGGVVDFLTAVPTKDSLTVSSGMGSFGENEESAMVTLAGHGWSELAAGERNFSTGFMPDRDYRNENASSETRWKSPLGTTDVLLAGSDRAFGANQFYGPYNSWERTKGWFGAVRQELGPKMEAVFGYRRHTDNFILLRNDPAFYANNHIDESYQAVLRRKDKLSRSLELFSGLEEDGDAIQSNNLGRHARNQGAGYLDLEIQPKGRWTASAGLREEILSGGGRSVLSPDVAANIRVSQKVRLRGSVGYGFRLPTYTDLYYSDPATIGNANLKPESAWSEDGGVDWFPNAKVEAELTAFYSRQHDTIDYVRANPQDKWHAANLTGLRFTGLEGLLTWQATRRQQVRLGWTGISGAQRALHGLQSEYVFNYPVNNASFAWRDHLRHAVLLQTRVLVAQRYEQTAYPVWDVEASRQKGRIRPYLRALNLSNTGYEEIQGVRMPGRSLTGGLEIQLGGS